MRIKLIYPPVFRNCSQHAPPVSIPSLTAVLRGNNHHVNQDDLLIKVMISRHPKFNLDVFFDKQALEDYLFKNRKHKKFDEILDKILKLIEYKNFDLIGLGAMSRFQFLFALLLAKKIKEKINTPIVIGGCHLTSVTPNLLNRASFVDYMVVGCGELAILRLVGFLEGKNRLKDVPGLLYKKNGRVCQNQPKNMGVDKIPLPDFDGLQYSLYKPFKKGIMSLAYQTSIGCPFRCSFCELTVHKYAAKPITKVIKELKLLSEKYGVTHFEFVDHTINVNYHHLTALCDAIIKMGLNITWDAYARIDNIDFALLNKMGKAGCKMLRFEVESGSDRLLNIMNKGIKSEQAAQVLKLSHEAGIKNAIFLISGFPGETEEDLEATLKFIRENSEYINNILLKPFHINSNSIIKKNPKAYGIKSIRQDSNSELFSQFEYVPFEEAIPKQLSYEKIFVTYFRYVLRRRFPFLRLVPVLVFKLILRRKKLHRKIVYNFNKVFR